LTALIKTSIVSIFTLLTYFYYFVYSLTYLLLTCDSSTNWRPFCCYLAYLLTFARDSFRV